MKVVITLGIAVLLLLALLSVKQNNSGSVSQKRSWEVQKISGHTPTAADIEFVDFDFEQFAMSR